MTRYRSLLVIVAAIASFCFTGSTRAQQASSLMLTSLAAIPGPPAPPPTPPGFVHHPVPPGNHVTSSPPIVNRVLTPQEAAHQPPPASCCGGSGNYWTYQEIAYPTGNAGTTTYSGTEIYIDPQDDNPVEPAGTPQMPGNIYQWIGTNEVPDGLFIQVGIAVLPGNAFYFFAYNQLPGQALQGQPVNCDPNHAGLGATQSYNYANNAQGCLAPIGNFNNTTAGYYADLALQQVGQTIEFWVYAESQAQTWQWYLLMSLTDSTAGAGFQATSLTEEYTAQPNSPDITALLSYPYPLNMRGYFEFAWQNTTAGSAFTTTQNAYYSYRELPSPPQPSYSGPNPVCPPFQQFATYPSPSYSSYYVGNWASNASCPGTYPGSSIS